MGNWVEFEIKGLRELQANLEALPEKVAGKGIRKSLRAGAQIILSAFVAAAPRRTGFLASHFAMRTKMRLKDLAGSAYVGPQGHMDYPDIGGGYREKVDKKGRKHKVGRIAVDRVAKWLEYGQRGHAHPFMTQAWESHRRAAVDAIIDKLKTAIDDAARQMPQPRHY
jgi:HK97 gp10 family phage protein